MNQQFFDEFIDITRELNRYEKKPLLIGSLGLEFVIKKDWNPSDIDIHLPGDPRGWEAPDEDRIYDFDIIQSVMENLGYELVDLHEHEFKKGDKSVEIGSMDSTGEFAGIDLNELIEIQYDGAIFLLPTLEQFLKVYEASSKDSYRNDNNNDKDFDKIKYLKSIV